MSSRQFHCALSALHQGMESARVRSLRLMAEEWLEAVEAGLEARPPGWEAPAARFSEHFILEWINPAAASIFQRPPQELVGSPITHLARARNLPTYLWCIRRALQTGQAVYAYLRGSGSATLLCEYRRVPGTYSVHVEMYPLARPCLADFTLAFATTIEQVRVIE